MLNGYKIIDADSHVIEPQDMWLKYLEPEFKEFAPSLDMKIKGQSISYKISSLFLWLKLAILPYYKHLIKS